MNSEQVVDIVESGVPGKEEVEEMVSRLSRIGGDINGVLTRNRLVEQSNLSLRSENERLKWKYETIKRKYEELNKEMNGIKGRVDHQKDQDAEEGLVKEEGGREQEASHYPRLDQMGPKEQPYPGTHQFNGAVLGHESEASTSKSIASARGLGSNGSWNEVSDEDDMVFSPIQPNVVLKQGDGYHENGLINYQPLEASDVKRASFICSYCRKELSCKQSLDNHQRVQHFNILITCPQPGCGAKFGYVSTLKDHFRKVHGKLLPGARGRGRPRAQSGPSSLYPTANCWVKSDSNGV